MREQMMKRYMNAVKTLANRFEDYTNGAELVADYYKAANEVTNITEELARDLGLCDVSMYTNKAAAIMREAYQKAGDRITKMEFQQKTDEAIAAISNLLK
jgi:hypothetical protein